MEIRYINIKMFVLYGFEGGDWFGEDYEFVWVLNVYVIDMCGVIFRMFCIECR